MNIKSHHILFTLFILLTFSCKVSNTSVNTIEIPDKSKFIILLSEANKFRLLGENDKAKEYYLSAIQVNKESAVSNFYLSVLFAEEKLYSTALEFAEKAVRLQPNNKWYTLAKADMLFNLSQFEDAANIYSELFEIYTDNELYYKRLENTYIKTNNKKALIKLYRDKLYKKQFDNETALNLYELYRQENNVEEAEKLLISLSNFNNNSPKFKALLAEYYLTSNRTEKASELYSELLGQFPNNDDVLLSYAYYSKYTGKKDLFFESVKKLMDSDFDIHTKINLIITGQYPNFPKDEYLEILTIMYQNHSDEIEANTLFAEFYIDMNDLEKAIQYIEKAVDLNKSNFNLIVTLFELYYDANDFNNLFEKSEEIKEIYPNRPKVFLYNGIAAFKIGKYEKADETLSYGKDILINDKRMEIQFYYYLAESNKKLKNHLKSDSYYEKTLSLNENFKPAMISYSINLSKRNLNLLKAEKLAKQCYLQNKSDKAFQYAYALALFKQKKCNDALFLTEALIKQTENPVYLELHGNIMFCKDQKDKAKEFWISAKKHGSNNTYLDYKIQNINHLQFEDL
jgi:predicted Zn-dependent protease